LIVSLNEVAAVAQRATSGCGHAFGIAEEMGYAIRWLCERDLRGAEKLLHALSRFQDTGIALENRADGLHVCSTGDETPSPLILAPSIGDLFIAHRQMRTTILVRELGHPLLLLPFISRAASAGDVASISWTTVDGNPLVVNFNGEGCQIFAADPLALIQARAGDITCRWETLDADAPSLYTARQLEELRRANIARGCKLNDSVWSKLQTLAHKTYVPISEASRLSGAGAGLTDND